MFIKFTRKNTLFRVILIRGILLLLLKGRQKFRLETRKSLRTLRRLKFAVATTHKRRTLRLTPQTIKSILLSCCCRRRAWSFRALRKWRHWRPVFRRRAILAFRGVTVVPRLFVTGPQMRFVRRRVRVALVFVVGRRTQRVKMVKTCHPRRLKRFSFWRQFFTLKFVAVTVHLINIRGDVRLLVSVRLRGYWTPPRVGVNRVVLIIMPGNRVIRRVVRSQSRVNLSCWFRWSTV